MLEVDCYLKYFKENGDVKPKHKAITASLGKLHTV